MSEKKFELNELVWAKMKGYPPWPGRVVEPPSKDDKQKKKKQHYIFFYSSENYAWIPDENIFPHSQSLVKKYSQSKNSSLKSAIKKIVEEDEKPRKEPESAKTDEKEDDSMDISHGTERREEAHKKRPIDDGGECSGYQRQRRDSSKRRESSSSEYSSSNSENANAILQRWNQAPKRKMLKKKASSFSKSAVKYQKKSFSKKKQSPSDVVDEDRLSEPGTSIGSGFLRSSSPPPEADDDDDVGVGKRCSTGPTMMGLLARKKYIDRPETPPLDIEGENPLLKERNVQPTEKRIGFLGMGKMGQGIVKNLLHSGHHVSIWNRTTEKCDLFSSIGAVVVETPFDLVQGTDIIFSCVSDTKAVDQLVRGNFGVLQGMMDEGEQEENRGKGYVEMTSVDTETSKEIAKEIRKKGGRYLEAQLNGTRQEAIDGTMTVLCAGDESLFDECRSCFDAMSRRAMYVGEEIGDAIKMTTVRGMFCGTLYAMLAEFLTAAKCAGLDQKQMLDIAVPSVNIPRTAQKMMNEDYTAEFPLKDICDSLRLGLELGSASEQHLPILSAVNESYKHLIHHVGTTDAENVDASAIYAGTNKEFPPGFDYYAVCEQVKKQRTEEKAKTTAVV